METNYPKILFITVNGWNNTTGTSTITSIIEGYPKECIANIFLRADLPNSPVCDNYFRIDELKVLKSIFYKKIKTGYKISSNALKNIDFATERATQNSLKSNKNIFTPFIRDFVWKIGNWKSKELIEFVSDFNPDLIIFPAEGLIHFNNIGLYISKLLNKPIGLFFWDDNFTFKPTSHLITKIYRFLLRKNIKKISKKAEFAFSLNPKMQSECLTELNRSSVLLTKPIVNTINVKPYQYGGNIIKILYTGSIYIGRGDTILELIEQIKKINTKYNKRFFLEIYTNSSLTDEAKKKYNIEGVSSLLPPVTKEKVIELQQNSDILLFAEALEGKHKYSARLSFSTKITDYLSARRCILAIGPSDIAPIEYLKNNDIALVADKSEEIFDILEMICFDSEILSDYAEKSYQFGTENHSKETVYKTFRDIVINSSH